MPVLDAGESIRIRDRSCRSGDAVGCSGLNHVTGNPNDGIFSNSSRLPHF